MIVKTLFTAFKRYWWVPAITAFTFTFATYLYLSDQHDMYRSSILLAPVSQPDSGSLSGLGNIGGLASVAGINLGGGGSERSKIALKMVRSTELIATFLNQNRILEATFAAKGWDFTTNQPIFDNNIYIDGKWVREARFPKQPKPSDHEASKVFEEKYLNIHEEPEAGFVTISLNYYSPNVAQEWLSKFVELVNETIRQKDIYDATQALSYLQKQVLETKSTELENVLYDMIGEQHKKLMLATVTQSYVFEVINPPTLENESFHPKRIAMLFISLLLGLGIGCYFAIAFSNSKNNA